MSLKKADKDIRLFTIEARSLDTGGDNPELVADGYAAKFNSPTILYSWDGVDYKEVIDERAFDGADMSDVIFNYNHGGKVVARTRNNTLDLKVDSTGLHVNAKLGGTDEGRKLHQEIQGGYIDKMSFRFTVLEDKYDHKTQTRTILKFKKIYDVSAVDIPAYDDTNISARSFFETEVEAEKERQAAELAKEELRKKLILKTLL